MLIFHSADYQAVTGLIPKVLIISKLTKAVCVLNIFWACCSN